jgi:hypothetical protein
MKFCVTIWEGSTARINKLILEIRSTKFETRNNFQNHKFEFSKLVLSFGHSKFGFVSDFDIRISDLFGG